MENTLTNKAIYFAQHWGQLAFIKMPHEDIFRDRISDVTINFVECIPLKPLSAISDEDAIECVKLYKSNVRGDIGIVEIHELIRASQELKERIILNYWNGINNGFNVLAVYDYLRSQSFALPWMGLSVEELQSRGWLKIRE